MKKCYYFFNDNLMLVINCCLLKKEKLGKIKYNAYARHQILYYVIPKYGNLTSISPFVANSNGVKSLLTLFRPIAKAINKF